MISVIIPAHNEGAYIGSCLEHLLASEDPGGAVQVVVVANGCTDDTGPRARAMEHRFGARGWHFEVLDLPALGKPGALNAGDAVALYGSRVYIDADVVVAPQLLRQLAVVLDRPGAVYASGRLRIPPTGSMISDRYGQFWTRLPFVADGVPGCGVFAVSGAGRTRWQMFPDIISDDTFAQYHFSADEIFAVDAAYEWPITGGFANLVRVRRRQNQGVDEIRTLYPHLAAKVPSSKPGPGRLLKLALQDPLGFSVYSAVAMVVRLPLFRNQGRWDRGR